MFLSNIFFDQSSIRARDLKKLNKLIKKAGSVLETVLELMESFGPMMKQLL